MNLLPKASGTRPRVACEIMPRGVVAARSGESTSALAAVARVILAEGAIAPSLKPGNIADRVAVAAALRRALEQVGARSNSREDDVTLVIPDSAVRVLLLDFDALPNRLSEALPLVRFRLKKLLPFDADEAMVSFQVMSTSKSVVRVLAVAIPRDVLSEYETAAREAGFEPGAVLPSTLAALAVLDDAEPVLLVNANSLGVTTAIVRGGILLLHRSLDLQEPAAGTPANLPPALFEPSALFESSTGLAPAGLEPAGLALVELPLVDVHDTAAEWAAQQPLPEHGRDPYGADREYAGREYTADNSEPPLNGAADDLQPVALAGEIAQAVSVAAAYFEDTLAAPPERVLSAGPLGAAQLRSILVEQGVAEADGLRVRELVESAAIAADATSADVPRAWLSGVLGALRG
jgi:type IV pilus assembly protein PilM